MSEGVIQNLDGNFDKDTSTLLEYENKDPNVPGIGNLKQVTVLGNSFVRYIDHHGSDTRIVEAARISYNQPSKGEVQDKKLLRYLFKNKHTSPFEMVNITFNIRMPIFVMRQFVRHRTFRLNEMSARYTELDLGFYIPEKWREQSKSNKQGSDVTDTLDHNQFTKWLKTNNDNCFGVYESMLSMGVAKEMARMVLPVNILTEIYVNIDMSNLIKFFGLRDDPHAQWEHQEIARAMKLITKDRFPWCMEMYEEIHGK